MAIELSPEEWAQVRYKYEHTNQPVEDICFEHGMSSGTLRDRVRRWGWTRRNAPIAAEGPPPMPPIEPAAPLAPMMTFDGAAAPSEPAPAERSGGCPPVPAALSEEPPPDPAEIVRRLQAAIARVLPAIEAIVAKLATGPMPPREMERAVRTLNSLMRTLRESNGLLKQYPDPQADRGPDDPDEFALELLRRLEAFKAGEAAQTDGGDQAEGPTSPQPAAATESE